MHIPSLGKTSIISRNAPIVSKNAPIVRKKLPDIIGSKEAQLQTGASIRITQLSGKLAIFCLIVNFFCLLVRLSVCLFFPSFVFVGCWLVVFVWFVFVFVCVYLFICLFVDELFVCH